MGIVIQVTVASATKTLGKRYIAKCDSAHVATDYNADLTDSANMRFAANAAVHELNLQVPNYMRNIKYHIVASGTMPDGKSVVYIAEEI